jgi:hypothetical protein
MCSFNSFVYAVSLFPNLSKNFLVVIKSVNSLLTVRPFVTDVTFCLSLILKAKLSFFNSKSEPLFSSFFCFPLSFRGCKGKQVFLFNKCL